MSKHTHATEPRGEGWKGYTLSELRTRRAYVAVHRDMVKDALLGHSRQMADTGIRVAGDSRGIARKLMGALDYFDYLYLALKVGGRLMRLMRRHRGSGKKQKQLKK